MQPAHERMANNACAKAKNTGRLCKTTGLPCVPASSESAFFAVVLFVYSSSKLFRRKYMLHASDSIMAQHDSTHKPAPPPSKKQKNNLVVKMGKLCFRHTSVQLDLEPAAMMAPHDPRGGSRTES